MTTYRAGGMSLHYTEAIGRKWFARNRTLGVHVHREATLTPDLAAIVTRHVRNVTISIDSDALIELEPQAALWLRDALADAVRRVEIDEQGAEQ